MLVETDAKLHSVSMDTVHQLIPRFVREQDDNGDDHDNNDEQLRIFLKRIQTNRQSLTGTYGNVSCCALQN